MYAFSFQAFYFVCHLLSLLPFSKSQSVSVTIGTLFQEWVAEGLYPLPRTWWAVGSTLVKTDIFFSTGAETLACEVGSDLTDFSTEGEIIRQVLNISTCEGRCATFIFARSGDFKKSNKCCIHNKCHYVV